MSILNKGRTIAAVALAAVALAATALPAGAKPGVPMGPSAMQHKKLKLAVFICNISRRPNVVVLRNHNLFTVPKGAKFFFVASNSTNIVAQGWRTLGKTLNTNQSYAFKFSMQLVIQNGRPTGCRAYVRWYA